MVDTVPKEENLFLQASKEVDKWFLMGSPWPVLMIVSAYLLFVLKIGPDYMKNRKPLNIKGIMLIYNLYQTLANAHIVSQLFTTSGALSYIYGHNCYPMDPAKNPYCSVINRAAWLFLISKVVDLLDTIFMVLRKKYIHITFLHVYHHVNMVLFSWYYLKYIKGEQGILCGALNASVHVVMYSYYFLSALGPEVQKYLWWKKYITKLQMVQFVMIFIYILILVLRDCPLSKAYSTFLMFESFIFFLLFLNFYIQTYIIKPRRSSISSNTAKTK